MSVSRPTVISIDYYWLIPFKRIGPQKRVIKVQIANKFYIFITTSQGCHYRCLLRVRVAQQPKIA
jgi:hypothetical protein